VYFPNDCFVSMLTTVDADRAAEVGLIGSEGMIGIPMALGVAVSPFRAVVQGEGMAMRMKTMDFRRSFSTSAALKRGDLQKRIDIERGEQTPLRINQPHDFLIALSLALYAEHRTLQYGIVGRVKYGEPRLYQNLDPEPDEAFGKPVGLHDEREVRMVWSTGWPGRW
jgi:hypothetical protein